MPVIAVTFANSGSSPPCVALKPTSLHEGCFSKQTKLCDPCNVAEYDYRVPRPSPAVQLPEGRRDARFQRRDHQGNQHSSAHRCCQSPAPGWMSQGHRLFQSRVGQARFERRPTVEKPLEKCGGPARRSAAGPTLHPPFSTTRWPWDVPPLVALVRSP